jgi:3-hydroxybutyryl-CoA dehydratase
VRLDPEACGDAVNKGDRFQESFTVSPEVYEGFMQVFKDRNPLHTDREFATAKGFRSQVMHGNILNGFLSYFVGECLPMENVMIHSQEINYTLPVYLNDRLTLNAEVADVFESVGAIEIKFHFTNDQGKKVAKGKFQIGMLS